MHRTLLYAAFGWLGISGALHYVIDVVAYYMRGQRRGDGDAMLYYGLHTAYSLGQVTGALLALLAIGTGSDLFERTAGLILGVIAVAGWLAISIAFSGYTPPRINAAIVLALLTGAMLLR